MRKYGEKFGEVLLSFAGSAKAINLISKVAPALTKVLNKLKKASCNCFTAGTKVEQIIKDALLKYYTEGKAEEYLEKCKSEVTLPLKIKEFIQNNQFKVMEMNFGGDSWPSSKWLFDLGLCEVNGFKVHFTSSLMISKLVKVYYLQHEFSVDNLDPLRTIPKLDGFDVQPFTKSQQELEDIIYNQLVQHQLSKLSFNELNEVINELSFPKEVSIFGSQVTVEYAFFHDLLDLC